MAGGGRVEEKAWLISPPQLEDGCVQRSAAASVTWPGRAGAGSQCTSSSSSESKSMDSSAGSSSEPPSWRPAAAAGGEQCKAAAATHLKYRIDQQAAAAAESFA